MTMLSLGLISIPLQSNNNTTLLHNSISIVTESNIIFVVRKFYRNSITVQMKKVFLLTALLVFFVQSQAQKVLTKDVPAFVRQACMEAHPKAMNVKWTTKGSTFQCEFIENKKSLSATFDNTGFLLENERNIPIEALPRDIITFINSKYKNKKINAVSKMTDRMHVVRYQVQVDGKNLVFDDNGNYLKSFK